MTKVQIKENGKEVSPEGVYYLKHTGNFNYFVTVEVRAQPQSTTSSLLIYCYSNAERTNVIATLFRYRRKKNDSFEVIHNRSNCFRCSVKDMNSYIEIKITPSEEDFFGECTLIYGQIELDAVTKSRYKKAKLTEGFQMECVGRADNLRELNILRFEGDELVGLDSNLKEVKRLAIEDRTRLLPSSFDGKKLKILNRAGTDELDLNFESESDKDLALLLVEHKKKLVREGRSTPFVIRKTQDNRLYKNQNEEPSLNDTFQENLHSLTGLLNRTDSAEASGKEVNVKGQISRKVNNFQANGGNVGNLQMNGNNVAVMNGQQVSNGGQMEEFRNPYHNPQQSANVRGRMSQRDNQNQNQNNNQNQNPRPSQRRESSPLQVKIDRKRLSAGRPYSKKEPSQIRVSKRAIAKDAGIQNQILHEVDANAESPIEQELLQIPQVKHVDSQNGSELLMAKNLGARNFRKAEPPKQYEKVVAFDPGALERSQQKSERSQQPKLDDPPKKPKINRLLRKNNFKPWSNKKKNDLSQEIMKFEGLSEEELDRRLNDAFKKENVQVQKGGRDYITRKDPNKTDSFFNDIEFSREYGLGLGVPKRFSERVVKGSAPGKEKGRGENGSQRGSEYRNLYRKLNSEFENEKLKKENESLRESQVKSEKKLKRLKESQKGLLREIKMLRSKKREDERNGEQLEAEKQIQMKKQLRVVTEKWRENRKLYENEKQNARESMIRLEEKNQKILELESQGLDLKRSLQIKDGELARVAESKNFFEKKVSQVEMEKERLQAEVQEKEELRSLLEAKDFEIQNGENNLRNMKISIYEAEVNEKILEKQYQEAKTQIQDLKKDLQHANDEKTALQAELRTTKRLQHELGRELKLRKGAGILEKEKTKLKQEARQFEEFSRKKDREIERLRAELEQAKEEKRAVEKFYASKRGEKEEMLMAEIKDWERDSERHERKIVDLQFDLDLARRENTQQRSVVERLKQDVEKYKQLEAEYLKTVKQINDEQERMSRRSEGLRTLDETKDRLIQKLQQKLKNQKKVEDSLSKNLTALNEQIDDNRRVHLEYIETINKLKGKLAQKNDEIENLEKKERNKKMFNVGGLNESMDLPFRSDDDIIMENMTVEESVEVGEMAKPKDFAEVKRGGYGIEQLREGEGPKVLEISKNEEFIFASNSNSLGKLEMRFGSGDPGATYGSATDEFQRKKEIAEKEMEIKMLKKVWFFIFLGDEIIFKI